MLVWTGLLLGKLEVYTILDKVATDQTDFFYFTLSPTYVKTQNAVFAVAWTQFWMVQSIFFLIILM
jgi:hypothetical protein